ncbi:hypothetical protein BZA77DRAFT_322726 [Pyronema omphalodes]|nr:hypothetical protein BZA77DRAFT_322726 [Pyronema omphalodes]
MKRKRVGESVMDSVPTVSPTSPKKRSKRRNRRGSQNSPSNAAVTSPSFSRQSSSTQSEPAADAPNNPTASEQALIPISPKQHRRFFLAALLLHTLNPIRGERRRRQNLPHDLHDISHDILRDRFLDAVAYICDKEKGGNTVAAAALQDDPGGPILVLASNSVITDKTLAVLKDIFRLMRSVEFETAKPDEKKKLEDDIVRKLAELGRSRLKDYQNLARPLFTSSKLKRLDSKSRTFLLKLQSLIGEKDNFRLVRNSYDAARSEDMQRLVRECTDGNSIASEIRHYIYRLGHYVSVAKTLILTASIKQSQHLILELRIRTIRPAPKMPSPLRVGDITLSGILSKVCRAPDIKKYTALAHARDRNYDLHMEEGMRTKYDFKTRIHAELLLIDHFRKNDLEFYPPNRRYIGCSKDACYLCDRYVAAMKGPKFELRGCHQKIYIPWRPPDLQADCDKELVTERRDILNEMMDKMRDEILEILDSEEKSRKVSHPDSTTGVSMVPPPTLMSQLGLDSVLTKKFNRSNDSFEVVVDEDEFYRSESGVSSSDNSEGGVQFS